MNLDEFPAPKEAFVITPRDDTGATRKASRGSFVVVVAQRRPDCGPDAPIEAAGQCPVLGVPG